MDQEKFDQHLMDYLFDELDEVTTAAMKRKLESDAACRELEAGLRATLEVAQLPVEEPDDDLEERILAAAHLAEKGEPLRRKVLRSLAWAGSHAMRPQLAMAAILMLVVGSSVLLLRARPGSVAVTPVKDDAPPALGQGVPDAEAIAAAPEEQDADRGPDDRATEGSPASAPAAQATAAPDAAAIAELEAAYERGLANRRAGNWAQAQSDFAQVAASKSAKAPSAAFFEADATRAQSGCSAAAPKFEGIMNAYGGSAVGEDAAYALADCLKIMGQNERARAVLRSLLDSKTYADRAGKELNALGEATSTGGSAVASKQRAAAAEAYDASDDAPPKAAEPPQAGQPPQAAPPKAAKPPEADAPPNTSAY